MQQTVYPILQSGFIGITDKGLKRPDPVEPTFREAVIFKEFKAPLAKYKYSPDVSDLFFDWSARPELLRNFEFREKIIKAAFQSFGTMSIYTWFLLQNEKPTVSEMHRVFLIETLEFIANCTPRKIQPVQWTRLLEADLKSDKIVIDLKKHFVNDLTAEQNIGVTRRLPLKTDEFLTRWLQCPNGFEDMLVTLFTIFGERSRRTDITNLTS